MATNILHSHDGSVEGDRRTERERERLAGLDLLNLLGNKTNRSGHHITIFCEVWRLIVLRSSPHEDRSQWPESCGLHWFCSREKIWRVYLHSLSM